MRRLAATALLSTLLLAGCRADDATPSLSDARAAVTRYVAAMVAGDFDKAMQQRCEAAQVKASDEAQFTDQLARLTQSSGPLILSSVDATARSGLRPAGGQRAFREVTYRIAVKGAPSDQLRTVVVHEGGTAKLCGFATNQAAVFRAEVPGRIGDLGPTARSPQELMPASPGPGYRIVSDSGEPGNWSRAWQVEEYGGARVTAQNYSSASQAAAGAAKLIDNVAGNAVSFFNVPGFTQAVGIRYLGFAWLGVQPPTEGPFIDRVVLRFGTTVVDASVSNLPADSDDGVVLGLAAEIVALARA